MQHGMLNLMLWHLVKAEYCRTDVPSTSGSTRVTLYWPVYSMSDGTLATSLVRIVL